MIFLDKATEPNGPSDFDYRVSTDNKQLFLRLKNLSREVSIDISDNKGDQNSIRVDSIQYSGGNGTRIHFQNTIQEIREKLRNIYCMDSSLKKENFCFRFFESVQSILSFQVLFDSDPNYYKLIYNDGKILVCNPFLMSFEVCRDKSKKINYSNDENISKEFNLNKSYRFNEILIPDLSLNQKRINLEIATDYGTQYYLITYPSNQSSLKNSYLYKKDVDIFLNAKALGLLAFTPVPILLDVIIFPYSIYYLFREYGKNYH